MIPESETSTSQYERQAETIRHSLTNSLNELNQRLTPGQVFDEVMSYAKGGGGTFLKAFSNAARENPIPSLLIGTGCMMFVSERLGLVGRANGNGTHEVAEHAERRRANRPSAVRRAAAAVGEGVRHGMEAVGDSLGNAAQSVREKALDARDTVSGAIDQVKESAVDLGADAGETAAHARQQAAEKGRQLKDRASRLIDEQPLLVAGIGLAVGAVIAAMLPATRVEDELMGETSDSVRKSLGEVASEQFETARAAAGRVAQEAKNAAEREGLTPSRAAEMVRDVGDKVTRVAHETARAGEAEIRQMDTVDPPPSRPSDTGEVDPLRGRDPNTFPSDPERDRYS